MAWLDVIEGVGWCIAVGALAVPCGKDLLSESLLCGALWYERGSVNLMIHAAPG